MEKIILVHYMVFREHHQAAMVKQSLRNYHEKVNKITNDPNIINLILPVFSDTEHHRIECINPKLVTGEEHAKALDVVNNAQKFLDEWMKTEKI